MFNFNGIPGIIFHNLRGKPGWSNLQIRNLDVALITHVSYHKRLFCIFDSDCPWTLQVQYALPRTTYMTPVITVPGTHIGTTVGQAIQEKQFITVRFPSKEDCDAEVKAIHMKQTHGLLLRANLAKQAETLLTPPSLSHGSNPTVTQT